MPPKATTGGTKPTDQTLEEIMVAMQKTISGFAIPDRWNGFMYREFQYDSAARPSTCAFSCRTCSDQYVPLMSTKLPMPLGIEVLDDDKATSTITKLKDQTRDDLKYLRGKIKESGDGIAKRWQKKIKSKTAGEVLKLAKPDIFPREYAEMRVTIDQLMNLKTFDDLVADRKYDLNNNYEESDLFKWGVKSKEAQYDNESTLLVSYLDLETLTKTDQRLLALLHYRTVSEPSDWVMFDRRRLQATFHLCTSIHIAYNPHCVVMQGDRFGDLVQWNMEAAHRWDIIAYPMACLIIRAQNILVHFLRKVVELLLTHEPQTATKSMAYWYQLVDNGFLGTPTMEKQSYRNPTFTSAPNLNLEDILSAFKCRYNAASDRVSEMQTDPFYARQAIDREKTQRNFSRLSPTAMQDMLFGALENCLHFAGEWQWSLSHVNEAHKMWVKHKSNTQCGRPLPQEYATTLTYMEAALTKHLSNQLERLRILTFLSPAFTHSVKWGEHGKLVPAMTSIDAFEKDPLFWCLDQLTREPFESIALPPSWHINFFEEQLNANGGKARVQVDPDLYALLSDIATVDEALTALRYHRPQYGHQLTVKESGQLTYDTPFTHRYGALRESRRDCTGQNPELWKVLEQFMNLPMPSKLSNRASIDQYEQLYKGLRAFWAQMSSQIQKTLQKGGISKAGQEEAIASVSEPLSTRHQEEVKLELAILREAVDAKARARLEKQQAGLSPNQAFGLIEAESSTSKFAKAQPKAKVKTRPPEAGPAQVQPTLEVEAPASADSSSPRVVIYVNRKSLETFHEIFSTSKDAKGSIKWDDFVSAMVDANCSASHTGGSAVDFTESSDQKRSVTLHMPHPDLVIEGRLIFRFRNRLNRRLDWDEDTFVDEKQLKCK